METIDLQQLETDLSDARDRAHRAEQHLRALRDAFAIAFGPQGQGSLDMIERLAAGLLSRGDV